ncbi:serine/threonine protein kinase [Streptomyces anulatus]|uniref:serine/threonine protein kinase n=1 Tax=Streptomyces anulatus TaxID=1892 RepID=UPI00224FAF61|nr:serine/threonine protein kinase [Streptomyces anulatus]MCX4489943.1 serine/threonine protein kinase [Streptomyces anulatus]
MSLSGLRTGDPKQIGRWSLVGRLGAGGMGVVFLAQDADGQLVAIKQLREDLASDSEFRARFRREAGALLRVKGTCTAGVLAVEVETSSPFVVMEYVQAPTLAEHVGEQGPLRGAVAHSFAVGLAEALVTIHQAGVVHRDLKPGNVLLSERGPKVIDFGIAQAADATALTRTGVTVGTVGYMAPEQLRGQAGPPADVFAWALTVAYATTGRPPFGSGPGEAVLHRVLHEEPDLDGVPAHLKVLLTSALSRSPERRPTPERLLSELTSAQDPGAPIDIHAVSTVLATARQIPEAAAPPASAVKQRTPRAAAAAAAVVLLLSIVGILWVVLPDHRRSTESSTTRPPSRSAGTTPSSSPVASAPPTTPAAVPSRTPPPPPSTSTGSIRNIRSGLCVDTNGPQRPGLNVELRACGKYSGQRWRYDETSLRFTNTPSDLCLDTDGKPATGVTAVVNPCDHYSGQRWRYDIESSQFINPKSGLCLDTNGPPAIYVDLVLKPCGNYTGQRWRM